MRKKRNPIIVASAVALGVCLACYFAVSAVKSPEQFIPTPTPAITKPPKVVTEISTDNPTATERPVALIPGLDPNDVIINLEDQFALQCSKVTHGTNYYIRDCAKTIYNHSLIATIYGSELFYVDYINSASVSFDGPSPLVHSSYLGYVATIPFIGKSALQKQAGDWVVNNIAALTDNSQTFETTLGGIHFVLFGTQTAVTLQIGELK